MSFWRAKRVLITGDTGFKGSWLALRLKELGAEVSGLSLAPVTHPSLHALLANNYQHPVDINDPLAVQNRILQARPEIVFHLAAQSLVRTGYRHPAATFQTNAQGTANLLEALRIAPDLRAIVVVTSDKVYLNDETGKAFDERHPLGGHDPYSASKAAAEMIAASYRLSFFAERGIGLATARAGNVIGGGDWGQDRLIPDALRAFSTGQVLKVRRPQAIRPWQHVLEPLSGYRLLAERLYANPLLAGAYNFGPDDRSEASVRDVLALSVQGLGFGQIDHDADQGPHEAATLRLDSAKARQVLGHRPVWNLKQTIERTWGWYRGFLQGASARELCLDDIAAFAGQDSSSHRGHG